MTFLFWNHSIIAQHVFTSTQSASPRIEFWIVFMFLYLFIHSFLFIFFLLFIVSLYLFTLTKYDISVLKSFNNSPACIYFHSKCLTADWVLNCIYVIYLFIHSLIHIFFYYYLFVSLNLIYINQVWHFCLKSFKNTRPFTSTQSASPQLRTLNWFI